MSYDVKQFKDLIERVLKETDDALAAPTAVKLLLGTAAQESSLGKYLKQIHGPAVGAFQMEPATFDWLQAKYGDRYPSIKDRKASDQEWDLKLAIIMARLRYRADLHPLPDDTPQAMGMVWKRVYNTMLGKGTVEEFVANYTRFGIV